MMCRGRLWSRVAIAALLSLLGVSSLPGAAAVPCLAGTYGPDDGPCAPCPAGSYCLGGTDAVRCPERSSSSPNATELAGCFCLAGSSGDDGGPCVACPFGTYKVVNGTETCTACPEHTSTTGGAKAIEHCLCAKGYTGVGGNEPCEACTPGEPAALVQREVQCCPTVPTVFCWLISAIPPPLLQASTSQRSASRRARRAQAPA